MANESERERFNRDVAPNLATGVARNAKAADVTASTRFAYFHTDNAMLIVAGVQEARDCDLALAYGLTLCKGRHLILVLPRAFALATCQRAAFLLRDAQPTVWVHEVPYGGSASHRLERTVRPSRTKAIAFLKTKLGDRSSTDELYAAATPAHLGDRSSRVAELVEWATGHSALDPGHRRGERSWHCMGQKVLSIKGTKGRGLEVRAGIHYSTGLNAPKPHGLGKGDTLTSSGLAEVKVQVEAGIQARLEGVFHKPDEHWLQAGIRRRPELVGVEQPALREVPAWRPIGGERTWGRGYIDLVGVDGQGDLRLVETKLATNTDDLLMFQGLDYYIWALVYENALMSRLGAPKRAELVVHFVLGATPETGDDHVSTYAHAQAKALDIPWRFQVIKDWFEPPTEQTSKTTTQLLTSGQLPRRTAKSRV